MSAISYTGISDDHRTKTPTPSDSGSPQNESSMHSALSHLGSTLVGVLVILATFLAGFQSQLLSLISSDGGGPTTRIDTYISIFFYGAIFLHIFAVFWGVFCSIAFSLAPPFPNIKYVSAEERRIDSTRDLFEMSEASPASVGGPIAIGLVTLVFCCVFLGLGMIFTLIGLYIYIWSHQPKVVAITSSVIGGIFAWLMSVSLFTVGMLLSGKISNMAAGMQRHQHDPVQAY